MNKDLLYNLHKVDSISDSDAFDLIAECILGPDWYVIDPIINREQMNLLIVKAIIEKYDKINHTYMKQNWNKFISDLANKIKFKTHDTRKFS